MSYATATSVSLTGITGRLVPVQAEPAAGQPGGIVILGPDGRSMEEARDRVRAGIVNAGLCLPGHRVTVTLPPSDDPAPGSSTDLAMAAVILSTAGLFPPAVLDAAALIGEIGLDGAVRPVRGVLPMVTAAADLGMRTVVVPAANAAEARLVPGITVVAVATLQQLAQWASTGQHPPTPKPATGERPGTGDGYVGDLVHVPAVMTKARWVLEVAAAGGHHLGLVGPPGAGKTLIAQSLPSLLPDLDDAAALEVAALRSAAGVTPPGGGLVRRPPFRAPHHTASLPALLGGGPRAPYPGAVSLAHHGVLHLDNAPEFGNRALVALRHPLDTGQVMLAGARRAVTYPARFQLVLAAQPCPCARPNGADLCTCTDLDRRRCLARMADLWRRTDIRLHLDAMNPKDAVSPDDAAAGESSAVVAARVGSAREHAADRWAALGYRVNAEVPGEILRTGVCALPTCDINPLLHLRRVGTVSDDGHDRILRVAWTLCDLRGADRTDLDDVTTAIDLHVDRQP
ncbi:ATP-binding protein [Micromonospora sp. WMMD1082]|uniref:YifB family Mg chelatase-like AAA ATPase n=1 Tax=Micromonospora sp. WMMD1082 TaxID=3016104 RepID=UPI0024160F6D|nr:ATP-binding protein [Micromonospora sp. WMMD1082]MDG4793635.1 ATP-binding protein [Micromonospora sp. WMMD1082]